MESNILTKPPPEGEASSRAHAKPTADPSKRPRQPIRYDQFQVPDTLWLAIERDKGLPEPPMEPPLDWVPPAGRDRLAAWASERQRIKNDRLRDLDAHVIRDILRFNRGFRCYRWRSADAIAETLTCSVRSVRHSFRRLALNGFIRLVNLHGHDPDDPKNTTGYRIALLWMEDAPEHFKSLPDLDRRPPLDRKVWARTDAGGMQRVSSQGCLSDQPVSSPEMQRVSSAGMNCVSSNNRAGASKTESLRKEIETPPPSEFLPSSETPPSSSSPAGTDDDDGSANRGTGEDHPAASSIATFARLFGADVGERLRHKLGWIEDVMGGPRWAELERMAHWTYRLNVLAKNAGRKSIGNPPVYTAKMVANGDVAPNDIDDAVRRYGPPPALAPGPGPRPAPPPEPGPPARPTPEQIEAARRALDAPVGADPSVEKERLRAHRAFARWSYLGVLDTPAEGS